MKAIVLLLYTIIEVPEIRHPKFKFLVANDEDVPILNMTVAVDPDPEYVTKTELSKFVPAYI